MSLKRPSSYSMRALAARLPFKVPFSANPKLPIALLILVIFWTIGPNTVDVSHGDLAVPRVSTLEKLTRLPLLKPRPATKLSAKEEQEKANLATPPGLVLAPDEADAFCSHYHLERHNASAWMETRRASSRGPNQRRVYDLLLVAPTTSADMLELRLASLYPYVDYFVLLEAPPPPPTAGSAAVPHPGKGVPPIGRRDLEEGSGVPSSPDSSQQDVPSLLDRIWDSQLRAFQPKLIRHTLSQHSHDFKPGLDWTANTRNALYTRVIPLLNGQRKVQPGDILLVSDAEELVRPVAMKMLRNCNIPDRTTISTRKYWYSYQWMQINSPGVTRYAEDSVGAPVTNEDKARKIAAASRKRPTTGNEWWPHPQATVYRGAETIFPDDLRRNRLMDQYVFGDGGWTCHLCYPTIAETLLKLGDEDVIWFDGPRWKAAGRVVDRAMNGVELVSRDNLSRIDDNADLPPRLKSEAKRFRYMLDRDPLGANYVDFNLEEYQSYLAKKNDVDSEPDFETTGLDDADLYSADTPRLYRGPKDTDFYTPPASAWRNFAYRPDGGDASSELYPPIGGESRNLLQGLGDPYSDSPGLDV